MCAAAKNCGKFTKHPSFRGSRSFKVTDVEKSKKPVTSVCYHKQYGYTVSATVFTLNEPIVAK